MRRLAGIQVSDGTVQSQRSLPSRARGRLRRKTTKASRRARPPCSQPHRSSTDPRDGGADSLCDRLGAVWIEATGVQDPAAPLRLVRPGSGKGRTLLACAPRLAPRPTPYGPASDRGTRGDVAADAAEHTDAPALAAGAWREAGCGPAAVGTRNMVVIGSISGGLSADTIQLRDGDSLPSPALVRDEPLTHHAVETWA